MKAAIIKLYLLIVMSTLLVLSAPLRAENVSNNQSLGTSNSTSISDNMKAMDQDHDGIITTEEISHYLQSQRGRGYQQGVLDELERVSNARSCGSPFSRSVY